MTAHRWVKVVERRGQSVLISSYFYNGIQAKCFKKMLSLSHGLDHGLVLDYSYYYDADDFATCKKEIGELLDKTQFDFLKQSFEKIYAHGKELLRFSEKIANEKDNIGWFKTFSELCLEFGPALYFPVLVEELVENKVKEIMKKYGVPESLFVVLTASHKPTDGSNELLNLHRLALTMQKTGAVSSEAIKNHLAKYGWLSYTKFVGEQWTEATIRDRITDLAAHKNVAEEIKHLETIYAKNEEETKKIFKQFNVSSADQEIVRLAQELAYIRTYRIDVYTKAGFHAKSLFAALAHRLGITPEEFVFLTYEEIITLLENGEKASRDIIQKRKNETWQLKFDNGTMTFAYENFEIKDAALEQNEVRGNVAYTSEKIRGTAKIIRGVLEFAKMEKGDILVTSMTTPDFVPLMEKAAAIVTDEGGITSHAAIVSRELKKPCVIGTKFATKVFKDGDLVEVDAVNGVVRKIK